MIFNQQKAFNPDKQIPDLSGRVVLVTGGNNGLGKETVNQLAKHNPARIYLGARNQEKAQAAIAAIKKGIPEANVVFLEIDLASFSSIAKAVRVFLSEGDRLDVLVNNAGIFACPPGLTEDGYEIQFGTNYMGPALLTRLLLPCLEKTAAVLGSDVRVVFVSSALHTLAPKEGLILSEVKTTLERINTMTRYGQSKLAEMYFARCLAKSNPAITTIAVHPGVVRTGIMDGPMSNPIMKWLLRFVGNAASVDIPTGTLNQLWACTVPRETITNGGMYYPVGKEFKGRRDAPDEDVAKELWSWTESELKHIEL
ncbi:hypothetical protein J3E72DRAFT_427510 [Bipolaris maydis]|uniref:uncharacterized protein n=1 Tax=Cochliobolus heterostrophus TaxID=5016 RepID=UPI0024DB70E9|nr:hypothetical protein J3E73DRAFT_385531 [Bipolaris maydis]KAJ5054952.1 hypothetical protein J3E74DRAFT_281619 [Bipolaris maydis]KAJ6202829.1 hypothetical protein J3E72DRAFT_427510 [Bipolaris maydis]KAJ6275360.1 hypothetical protein PSV08DRAFT_212952 [Bipolaris maydis]KAJ6286548.1 hypothetical protein J3E71DRAFT_348371 [Bipolaris maydis]